MKAFCEEGEGRREGEGLLPSPSSQKAFPIAENSTQPRTTARPLTSSQSRRHQPRRPGQSHTSSRTPSTGTPSSSEPGAVTCFLGQHPLHLHLQRQHRQQCQHQHQMPLRASHLKDKPVPQSETKFTPRAARGGEGQSRWQPSRSQCRHRRDAPQEVEASVWSRTTRSEQGTWRRPLSRKTTGVKA